MENGIHLCIVTQDKTVFERDVSYVNIPAAFGSLGILRGHAPMVCAVSRGVVRCSFDDDGSARVEVGSGVAEVSDNELTILVSDAKIAE